MLSEGTPIWIGQLALVFRMWGYMLYLAVLGSLATVVANDGVGTFIVAAVISVFPLVIGRRLTRTHLLLSDSGLEIRNVWETIRLDRDQLEGATLHLPLFGGWPRLVPVRRATLVLRDQTRIFVTAVSVPSTIADPADAVDQLSSVLAGAGCRFDRSRPFPA